jgi:hypothetical protein
VRVPIEMRFAFFSKHYTYSVLLHWLFVYVFISQASLAGLVLCVGSNDHIAIEATHTGSAHEVPSKEHQSPCVDIPLAGPLVMLRDASAQANLDTALPTRAPVFVTVIQPILHVEDFLPCAFPLPWPLGDTPVAFLRSPILRI